MVNVSFRPHTLRRVFNNEFEIDTNGDSIPAKASYGKEIRCRFEQNGRAASYNLGDGRVSVYTYVIYLSANVESFAFGDTIELLDKDGNSVGEFTVLGFQRSQLNSKIWV